MGGAQGPLGVYGIATEEIKAVQIAGLVLGLAPEQTHKPVSLGGQRQVLGWPDPPSSSSWQLCRASVFPHSRYFNHRVTARLFFGADGRHVLSVDGEARTVHS